jgi:enoyl-CoA hydratase/carnithine racemase
MIKTNYKYILVEIKDSLATIRLNRAPDNSMNIPMLQEITQAHLELENREQVKSILVTSAFDGYFSSGLDINALLLADQKGKLDIFENLFIMCKTIYASTKLHVSFLNGHAIAGGAVLAAMSDFRFFLNGPYRIGFTESKIALGLPRVFIKIIESIVGAKNLKDTALLGRAYKPDEAFEAGLVDDVFKPQDARVNVDKFIKSALQIPRQSYQAIKSTMRSEILHLFNTEMKNTLGDFEKFFNDNFTEGLLAGKEKRRPRFK